MVNEALLQAGIANTAVQRFVDEWAELMQPDRIEVISAADDADDPAGVPIDAIIFGGRTRTREPLIRAVTDPAEGVYDGLTLGAEATFAAEGLNGLAEVTHLPVFAHVNWFQRDDNGTLLWPGYRQNLRALVWLLNYAARRFEGSETPVGDVPKPHELPLEGLELEPQRLAHLLRIDTKLWREEMRQRGHHLEQFALPSAITAVHRRIHDQFDNIHAHS